ncbi:MAG: heme-degrading monooxygenase HmoA [Polaribacter sp.]|jgi:heme-degrading monooxygenase HmoA
MQITTLTFFKYQGIYNKVWAFGMMQFAHGSLANTDGQQFYKLMGSGKGMGFNPLPDWSVYALLQIWESEVQANAFFEHSKLMKRYRNHSIGRRTYYMKNIVAKGEWSGKNPFVAHPELDENNPQLAIITRATIKPSKLYRFWTYVPTSQKRLLNNPDLLYTKGIGEIPIIQMATFSIWKNKEAVQQFAYKSKEHATAIKMTRELDWYSEELFARFQPYKIEGSLEEL